MCLRVLKESNKSRFDSYSRQKQCIDHIPYYLSGLSCAHFSDNLSQNSSILGILFNSTFQLRLRLANVKNIPTLIILDHHELYNNMKYMYI